MPIKGTDLKSIEANRFSKRGERIGNVRIDMNSTVTMITKVKNEEANINFRYTASYGRLGIVKIEGDIIFTGEVQPLIDEWNKTGKMPNNVASEIHTAIMRVCVPEAILISRDLHLPPPVPLPQVNFDNKKPKPSSGIEVA